MALATGTPLGSITQPEDIYLDVPPTLYFQENKTPAGGVVGLLNNPDSDGFYYGLSGTTDNPVFEMGCYEGFSLADQREVNMVRCDTSGDKLAIQKRTSLQMTFTLKQFFPLTMARHILNLSPVTTNVGASQEKMGIPDIDNTRFYYAYFPSIYDQEAGDFISATLHRVQVTGAWTLSFAYGQPATAQITLTAFADDTKPAAQRFGTFIRTDSDAI